IPPVIYTSSYSKILDFDILRLSKKVVSNNELASCFDGGVIPITEIGKERLNQLTSQLVNKKIDVANQFNDGFNNFVKMARHFNTIRHRCFIKIFMDDQRAMSLNADLREINEVTLYIDRKEKEFNLALGPYWIIPWIQQRIISFWEQYYYRFRAVRSDGTLFIYLISALAGVASRSLERTINTFGYEKMRLQIFQGEKNTDNVAYFLANKKIYSQRYVTDALSDLQEKQYSEAVFGFADLDSYKTVRASQSELAKQHSYFYADIEPINNSPGEEDDFFN
ncbi:MAG: hypothetical protein LBM99_04755, partial [Bacillales bacterium]|nr:hypothetical protein [Bacillales bacterium]